MSSCFFIKYVTITTVTTATVAFANITYVTTVTTATVTSITITTTNNIFVTEKKFCQRIKTKSQKQASVRKIYGEKRTLRKKFQSQKQVLVTETSSF